MAKSSMANHQVEDGGNGGLENGGSIPSHEMWPVDPWHPVLLGSLRNAPRIVVFSSRVELLAGPRCKLELAVDKFKQFFKEQTGKEWDERHEMWPVDPWHPVLLGSLRNAPRIVVFSSR
jgi:uncharacterized protein YbaR (Trm112 family)